MTVVLLTVFLAVSQTWADKSAPMNHWNMNINLSLSGVTHVDAELEMDFSRTLRRGSVFVLLTRQLGGEDGQLYHHEISDIHVNSPMAPDQIHTTTNREGNVQIRVDDANRYLHEEHTCQISYTATGLVAPSHPKSHLDKFSWNVIGNWRGRISNSKVKITDPEDMSKAIRRTGNNCKQSCTSDSGGKIVTYSLPSVNPGMPVQAVTEFPAGTFPGAE